MCARRGGEDAAEFVAAGRAAGQLDRGASASAQFNERKTLGRLQ